MDKIILKANACTEWNAAVNIEVNNEVDLFQCDGQLVLDSFFGNP